MKKLFLLIMPFLLFTSTTFTNSDSTCIHLIIHPLTDVTKIKRLFIILQIFTPGHSDNPEYYSLDMLNPFTKNLSPLQPDLFNVDDFVRQYSQNLYTIVVYPPDNIRPNKIARFIVQAYTWQQGDLLPTFLAQGKVNTKFVENTPVGYSIYLTETNLEDHDYDSYSRCELLKADQDCNDNNANMFPYRSEIRDNLDNDCDGITDEIIN